MRAWHDYHITGYSVDGESREVTFNISWPYETTADIRRALLVFSGVEAYFLEHDLGGNVIDAFSEEPLEEFLHKHASEFERSFKWGWPQFWKVGESAAFETLQEKGVKCFELSSSYGLSGWLLAIHVAHQKRDI